VARRTSRAGTSRGIDRDHRRLIRTSHDEAIVQKCLDAQDQNVAPYEAEIEAIAARLYGLTEAEG